MDDIRESPQSPIISPMHSGYFSTSEFLWSMRPRSDQLLSARNNNEHEGNSGDDLKTRAIPDVHHSVESLWHAFLMDVISGLAILARYGLVAVVWYSLLLANTLTRKLSRACIDPMNRCAK
jgi:hypothetical protein